MSLITPCSTSSSSVEETIIALDLRQITQQRVQTQLEELKSKVNNLYVKTKNSNFSSSIERLQSLSDIEEIKYKFSIIKGQINAHFELRRDFELNSQIFELKNKHEEIIIRMNNLHYFQKNDKTRYNVIIIFALITSFLVLYSKFYNPRVSS